MQPVLQAIQAGLPTLEVDTIANAASVECGVNVKDGFCAAFQQTPTGWRMVYAVGGRVSTLSPAWVRRAFARRHEWAAAVTLLLLWVCGASASAEDRANHFGDPFIQVTGGIASCPVPEGPLVTQAQMREQAHGRAERGTSCYQSGRCRLPNAYLYDKEIIPRVKKAIDADGHFADTSVWAEGQRRWVWLKGCVRTQAESDALEKIVRNIDDVENVINQLVIQPK